MPLQFIETYPTFLPPIMDIRNELMEHAPRWRRCARALFNNRDLADDPVRDTRECA